MRSRSFDFGDFEITKREILASISIIAVMLLIGFVISGRISNYILDRNEKYNKAIKIENSDLFEYGMRTNVGYAFAYGDLKAVDAVSYPEIDGEYMYLESDCVLWLFWVIWIIVIGLCIFGFYYIDNEWIEN